MKLDGHTARARRDAVKRIFDIFVATAALIFLSPVILLVGALVRLRLGRPVIFPQVRPGLRGEPFTIYKFRSMRSLVDGEGPDIPDEERLTSFGRVIRAASLDELPELWNVVKGDMSLVGPRPLLLSYIPRYSPEQARRHEVRPGITGLAQINGRNAISWEEKFALDVEYVDNHSLWIDLSILVRTLGQVLARQGISHAGHATMPEFLGSDDGDPHHDVSE